jgi:ribosomal protein S18 acetylase RimI-like enzyme
MTTDPAILGVQQGVTRTPVGMANGLTTCRLTNEDQAEVLEFLRERPLQTAVMSGLIIDNGIKSSLNRGSFYACRNAVGGIQAVALIGHAIFLESRCDKALKELARLARGFGGTHMIMGEQKMVERFWASYAESGQLLRHLGREVLLELNQAPPHFAPVTELRLAGSNDLSLIVPTHAAMASEESGVNPLEKDPEGFRTRCRRRIEQGRTWVLIEDGELIFKADLIVDTPEVIYLEGVCVHPERRRQGIGSRCVAQLSSQLLERARSISLLVNEQRRGALRFFQKLGYVARGSYDTVFLQERSYH